MDGFGETVIKTWLKAGIQTGWSGKKMEPQVNPEAEIKLLPDVYLTLPAGESKQDEQYAGEDEEINEAAKVDDVVQNHTEPEALISENKEPEGKNAGDDRLETWEKLFKEAAELYKRGVTGDKEAVMEAVEYLMLRIFDNAANSELDNLDSRFLRTGLSFRLPKAFFRRTATAIAYLEYLVKHYGEDQTFPVDIYWQFLYDLGETYRCLGLKNESLNVWEKLLSVKPDPRFSGLIQEQLGHQGRRGSSREIL